LCDAEEEWMLKPKCEGHLLAENVLTPTIELLRHKGWPHSSTRSTVHLRDSQKTAKMQYKHTPNNGTSETEVSPHSQRSNGEKSFQRNLGLGIETVVTEEAVVGREGKDDLSGASDKVLLASCLDSTHETEELTNHHR